MKRFLANARKAYDVILIKAPPLLTVPQSALLGHVSDICLHVAQWGKTPRRIALSSLFRLRNAGIPVRGVILTGAARSETSTMPRLISII
jgi:Mrp family chromosome partitioning ATPase